MSSRKYLPLKVKIADYVYSIKYLPSILRRYFFYKKYLKKGFDYKYYAAAAVMIKNEEEYIEEWIEYHRLIGFDHFYIFDNESTDQTKKLLNAYIAEGIVSYYYFKGGTKQPHIDMSNIMLQKSYRETYWIANLDMDEFIVLEDEKNIRNILKKFENFPGIEINWRMFGSSGFDKKRDGLVIERFTHHAETTFYINNLVKTIYNPRATKVATVHVGTYFKGKTSVNANGEENHLPYINRAPVYSNMWINHYYTKSFEEYYSRRHAGANAEGVMLDEEETESRFKFYDHNEVSDERLLKFVEPIKKALKRQKREN